MRWRRGGPKRASYTEQKKLVENAKKLAKDPLQVIPECRGNCFLCKYRRDKKKIKKIAKYKDDADKLKRYSKRGTDLSKAVAGTLLLAIEEKAPLLARASTPEGEISFAKRGNANKERLIGIQHFINPKLRLISYSKEAKKGYYFYSWDDKIICTGKEDEPPKKFVSCMISSTSYSFENKGDKYYCKSLSKDKSFFTLKWKGPSIKFLIDTRCAKPNHNLFSILSGNMISKDNSKSFDLTAKYNMKCKSKCESCDFDIAISLSKDLKEEYFKGIISDKELLRKYEEEGWKDVKKKSTVFAIGNECYGNNKDEFLDSFRYEEWEKPVLEMLIDKYDGIVLKEGTVNELLKEHWDEIGVDLIDKLVDNKKSSIDIFENFKNDEMRPREILKEAYQRKKRTDKLSNLPEFKRLPPKAKLAHEAAKIYKTEGEKKVFQYIDNLNLNNTRMKALAYGFLTAIDEESTVKWKYEDNEIESGEFMEEYVIKLLKAEGEEYTQALKDLLKISGSTESIVLEDDE